MDGKSKREDIDMARLRKAEPAAALQAAQALFWEHGYASLGTRQLEEEAGLTRFMLQTAYGGKKELFLQVVDSYLDYVETSFLPDVNLSSLEELARWFESRADPEFMPNVFCHGCLMLNSLIEFRGQDLEFNQKTERFFPMVHERFGTILESVTSNTAPSDGLSVADRKSVV